MDVVSLTRQLIAFNTINPPGNEAGIAVFVSDLLSSHGFETRLYPFAEGRLQLIAEWGISASRPPLVLSGHFDTVPLGASRWTADPFSGEESEGRLFGRGSSDMKGGLAAMVIAAIRVSRDNLPGGIRLIFSDSASTRSSESSLTWSSIVPSAFRVGPGPVDIRASFR